MSLFRFNALSFAVGYAVTVLGVGVPLLVWFLLR
jgi:hypothetical protein